MVFDLEENDLVDLDLHFWADEGDVEVSMELLELRQPSGTAFLGYNILGTNYCLQMNWLGRYNDWPVLPLSERVLLHYSIYPSCNIVLYN